MTVVHHAAVGCTLGRLLVAWTDRGVAAALLGDGDAALVDDLRRRRPGDALVASNPVPWVATARRIVDGAAETLPLDLRGTAFQLAVWRALQDIPAGETRTYGEVAEAIGRPTAVRAVGGAIGANPVAVAIPCHRVIRADGGIGGFRCGVARKRALLAREGVRVVRGRTTRRSCTIASPPGCRR